MKGSCYLVLLLCLSAGSARAEIYAALSADGKLQVSSSALDSAYTRFDPRKGGVMPPPPLRPRSNSSAPSVDKARAIEGLVSQVASDHGVEVELLHAVIHVESGYNVRAVSSAGALGLMQVMPGTGARFGAKDLFDPEQNVRAGAAYLRWLLSRYSGDISLALAAYNAGEGAVDKYGRKVPPYPETRAYVNKVLTRYSAITGVASGRHGPHAKIWSGDSG